MCAAEILEEELWVNHSGVLSLCGNTTAGSKDEEPNLSTATRAAHGVVILIISLLIVASNFVNVVVLRGSKQIPIVAKIFLTNLGLTDLSLGVGTCLPSVIPGITGRWPYGAIWCQFSGILHGTTVTVSIWTITVVSIERYFAVIHPHKYRDKLSVKKCFTVIIFLWFASLATYAAPNFTMVDMLYYQYNTQSAMCGMHWGNVWLCLVSAIYVPFLSGFTIVFTTISISLRLTKGNVCSSAHTDSIASKENEDRRKDKERKAVQLLMATAVVYFAFWGPYVVMTFSHLFGKVVIPAWLEFTVTWLANSNSFINVIIYSWIYPAFRSEAKTLVWNTIRCQCYQKSRQRDGRRVGPHTTESTSYF